MVDSGDTQHTETTVYAPQADNGMHTFEHDGLDRTYHLYFPDKLQPGAPLMYVMHGYGGTASGTQNFVQMNRIADENGFAVVYPQGTIDWYGNNFFNVGYSFHEKSTVDDVAFITSLTAYLVDVYAVSDRNVFATGFSNGGDMSYMLACEASDVFSAAAPVAATMVTELYDSCDPAKPIPLFEIHGTNDTAVRFEGDIDNVDGWGAYLDVPSVIALWVDLNGLDQEESIELADSVTTDGSSVIHERYWSANSDNEVWLYRVENGGHEWPGSWGNMDIDASTEIWGFFSRYVELP